MNNELPLIGRDVEVSEVGQMLDLHRLVTVLGAPGVGKTAIATRIARERAGATAQPSLILDLSTIRSEPQLSAALLALLGVKEAATGDPLQACFNSLMRWPSLLMLDNCEHLVDVVSGVIARLLANTTHLTLLLTSQVPLHLPEEHVYRLQPLAVPDPRAATDVQRAAGAVALFLHRARVAAPEMTIADSDIPLVVALCTALDGIPLAIEMAAAHVGLFRLEGLNSQLARRFAILASGRNGPTARFGTLHAALDWSFSLLPDSQRRLLQRLSVQAGSFSFAAVEAAAAEIADQPGVAINLFAALVDKSLVALVAPDRAEPRYRLLESVREFALQNLKVSGDFASTQERYVQYYLTCATDAADGSRGPDAQAWLDKFDADYANIVAAYHACDEVADGALYGLRLAAALYQQSARRGVTLELQQILVSSLARPRAIESPRPFVVTLLCAGRTFMMRKLRAEALATFVRARGVATQCDAPEYIGQSLAWICLAQLDGGNLVQAREAATEAYLLTGRLGVTSIMRYSAINSLALVERADGRYEQAAQLGEEALNVSIALGNRLVAATALTQLGLTRSMVGQWQQAAVALHDGLRICDDLSLDRHRVGVMHAAVGVALACGEPVRALYFEAASEALMRELGYEREPNDISFLAPGLAKAQRTLDAATRLHIATEARNQTYDQAIANLRQWLTATLTRDPTKSLGSQGSTEKIAAARQDDSHLQLQRITKREQELISLVARGFNNAEIASLLSISVLTVRTHRKRAMSKLELRNAAEVTTFAMENGLFHASTATGRNAA